MTDPHPDPLSGAQSRPEKTMLIVEDDAPLAETLVAAFRRRGYRCRHARSVEEAIELASAEVPGFAVIDLKLPGRSGLDCVRAFALLDPVPLMVVLTGYASIATAVEAIKLGARHYLAKPSTASEIEAAFAREEGDATVPLTARRASLRTHEWEHIQQVLREVDFNISEAARRLGMHRRTLARKLAKQQVN
ncbi:response regulator transcription factor [Paracoccus aminophilus]|uniref:Two component fis family transcriptional regulator n=1 Tax=Paracoccus aminophilus JCM 7686 TaxID=1367847 RepID=S5YAM1_PARAH|nr:response regulator [Paracoccus aminophilus]AGT08473.1 two component fis family transcriptional regulator [Paracoccus aminophilus JCM 7686]